MRELVKLNEEKLIFFDIETASVVENIEPSTPLFDSWEYKVNKRGDLTVEEIQQSFKNEAGLYPEFTKVVSIVVGKIVNGGIVLITLDDEKETDILNKFNSLLARNMGDKLVGFVNIGFDPPFVFKRMLINGIKPNDKVDSSGLKPWEVDEVDLSKMWQGTSFNRASLINVATAFGLPSPKDDISGADVGKVYWPEGVKRISKYCRKDVVTTINIFKCMRLEQPLVVTNQELEEQPFIVNLFGGAEYGEVEKEKLKSILSSFSVDEREKAYVILGALCSNAKGKKTAIQKKDITLLKKELK